MGLLFVGFLMVLGMYGSLFGPNGITSTVWFVFAECCALWLMWRLVNE